MTKHWSNDFKKASSVLNLQKFDNKCFAFKRVSMTHSDDISNVVSANKVAKTLKNYKMCNTNYLVTQTRHEDDKEERNKMSNIKHAT